MSSKSFSALVISKIDEHTFVREVKNRCLENLPDGEILIRVHYSSLNYKDGLSSIGSKGITNNYPHTPGIDASGIVVESSDSRFNVGDSVIVTSYDLGMNTSGGFGQYIRVPADWVVHLPDGLDLKESMVYGTAGYTAALSVYALQKYGIDPSKGKIIVTGSTGGVGSVSVALLAKLGYSVVASTGKIEENHFLTSLGAFEIIHRDELNNDSKKALFKERWAGAIDTLGGITLTSLLKSTKRGGAVAATGLVSSPQLSMTVFPFILRGVGLLGIDSGETPFGLRCEIWNLLAGEWKIPQLNKLIVNCTLENLSPEIDKILAGKQRGRVVVDMK